MPRTGGPGVAWEEIGLAKMQDKPSPCWGTVNMVGSDCNKFPTAQSLRMKMVKDRGSFLTLTVGGTSSLGGACFMDIGVQVWVCPHCCCSQIMDFEEAFEELGTGRDCNLWSMRVSSFASHFFSTAILLKQRTEMRAKCPAGLHGCKYQPTPSNLAAANALDVLSTELVRSSTGNASMNASMNESLGEAVATSFTKANISLAGASNYARVLAGGLSGLICPTDCSRCSAGTHSGGVPLVNDVCHAWCAYTEVDGACTSIKDLPSCGNGSFHQRTGIDCRGCQGCIKQAKDVDSPAESRTQLGPLTSSFECMLQCSSKLACRAWVYTSKPPSCQLSNATTVNFVDNNTSVSGLRCPG